jgi:phytol kinase
MFEPLSAGDLVRIGAFATALALLWVLTGIAKSRGWGREGDMRKLNHIAAFAGGAVVFGWLPEPIARSNLYALAAILVFLVALVCRFRDRVPFSYAFAANTRACDAPHEAFYFWSSWLISLFALAVMDFLFQQVAITRMAVLIVGIADGLAEPIGRRYGRHCYRVALGRGPARCRSYEGSAAVLTATLAVMLMGTTPSQLGSSGWVLAALATAIVVSAIESLSPRGTDNFTVQLASAGLYRAFQCLMWVA